MSKLKLLGLTLQEFNSSRNAIKVNKAIKIYSGEFILKQGEKEILILGKLIFDWFPSSRVRYVGYSVRDLGTVDAFAYFISQEPIYIVINGINLGRVSTTNVTGKNFEGRLFLESCIGNVNHLAERITFFLPNLKDIPGTNVFEKEKKLPSKKIILDNGTYIISIQKLSNFKDLKKNLSESGGFVFLYFGEALKKDELISYDESMKLLRCLNEFLNFINSSRLSALFINGIHKNKTMWADYRSYDVDSFEPVISWYHKGSIINLNDLWIQFCDKWYKEDHSNNLREVIDWYLESNTNKARLRTV